MPNPNPKLGNTLDRLTSLKARAETKHRERAEAEGALKETLRRLQAEFGCSSISAAEAMLAGKEARNKKDEEKFLADLAAYEKQFGEEDAQAPAG